MFHLLFIRYLHNLIVILPQLKKKFDLPPSSITSFEISVEIKKKNVNAIELYLRQLQLNSQAEIRSLSSNKTHNSID